MRIGVYTPHMLRAIFFWAAFAAAGAGLMADQAPLPIQQMKGTLLYRMTLMRATPGRQQELVTQLKARAAAARSSNRPPLTLRHSQGDQWDFMILTPIGSFGDYFAGSGAATALAPAPLIAWQEDEFVRGPDMSTLLGFMTANLYHVEMFVALADKRADLIKEREMENTYLRALGRPVNAIFTRELGAAWDVFTVGAYRNWKHYAERDDTTPEKSAAAARAAGFDSDELIGPFLRGLINTHHDTLATPLR
jgi:hypothetical protein